MAVQFPNMFNVDVNKGAYIGPLHPMFLGDANANRVGAYLFDGETALLAGGSCSGEAMLYGGGTVALTGVVSGNAVYVDLTAACYVRPGPIRVSVTWTDGTNTATVVQGYGNVNITQDGTIIDPGTIIPSVSALIADIDAAVASIPADYSDLQNAVRDTALQLSASVAPDFNLLASVDFNSGKYWYQADTMAPEATWGCYAPIVLKAGTYYVKNYQNVFTWVEKLSDGTSQNLDTYHSGTNLYTVPFDFALRLSQNSASSTSIVSHQTATPRRVEVGPNCQYKTIAAAVAATSDWDTIYVHSGTYTENVELWNKPRHLIGESRESTFIVDHSGAYATPPIEMSEGSLSNFTVIEDGANAAADADMSAYCLHIEWTPQTANSYLRVNNCTFINYVHSPLGCGLYQDYEVKFENCSFYCLATNEGSNERGSFYFHSNIGSNVTGQKIIAENCIISSAGDKAVYIGTPYAASGGSCRYRFSGCTIWSNGKGISDDTVFIQTDSDTTITKMINSYGNTVAKLNSTQPNTPEN